MKKIIRGRLYDTDTAKEVGSWEAEVSRSDFEWYEETLYRKKTGEFFLAGNGGPASKYAERSYGNWIGGSIIEPLSYEDAREWAEKHMEADDYVKWFELSDDTDTKSTITLRLSQASIDKLRMAASSKDVIASDIVEDLIKNMSI